MTNMKKEQSGFGKAQRNRLAAGMTRLGISVPERPLSKATEYQLRIHRLSRVFTWTYYPGLVGQELTGIEMLALLMDFDRWIIEERK